MADLQSTMVRLRPTGFIVGCSPFRVFTIHYGEIKTDESLLKNTALIGFTIHYGEIKTLRASGTSLAILKFTIHYGEIKTP